MNTFCYNLGWGLYFTLESIQRFGPHCRDCGIIIVWKPTLLVEFAFAFPFAFPLATIVYFNSH